jgi:hypothetical protein
MMGLSSKAEPTGTCAVMKRPPRNVRGAVPPGQSNQESGVIAGVRHDVIRDHTGLDQLDAVAETWERHDFVGRRLGEAYGPSPERPGEGLVSCQEGDALAVTTLLCRLGRARNSSVQSDSCQ